MMPGRKESREKVIMGDEQPTQSQLNIYEGTLIFNGEQIKLIEAAVDAFDSESIIKAQVLEKIRSSRDE